MLCLFVWTALALFWTKWQKEHWKNPLISTRFVEFAANKKCTGKPPTQTVLDKKRIFSTALSILITRDNLKFFPVEMVPDRRWTFDFLSEFPGTFLSPGYMQMWVCREKSLSLFRENQCQSLFPRHFTFFVRERKKWRRRKSEAAARDIDGLDWSARSVDVRWGGGGGAGD